MIAPVHPLAPGRGPVLPAPAIALEADHLAHEVPFPYFLPGKGHRVDPCPERGEIDAIRPHRWRAEDRLPAVDLGHHLARVAVEHVVKARRGSEVQVVPRHRRRAHIVHVLRSSFAGEFPFRLQRDRVKGPGHPRPVHNIDHATSHRRSGVDPVAEGLETRQAQALGRDPSVRGMTRMVRVELELRPVFRPGGGGRGDEPGKGERGDPLDLE